ncbi:MAG: SulP family inorganic anion transporter [Proteobacteria bacterium]|nr:SulP family inorganic anion transporter [Pseudomonadota bacterium]
MSKTKETKKLSISPVQLKTEILSGLTVALALVPEAVAFAFVAHVHPLVGLYAAFFIGLLTSIFGGRPGMISGATGALAVVMVSLVISHGVEYLFATVVLMGVIQILAGVLKLGKFIRIVPYPVMLGFVNGLAIVIFLAQLGQFKAVDASGALNWIDGSYLYVMMGLIALTMLIIHFLPKFTKAIPSSLAAILIVLGIVQFFGIETRTVGDMASIAGDLPQFHIPQVPWNLETLKIIFPYSVILAAVGLIESLLALTLIDEITETKGRKSRECAAQGFANVVTGFFGGMGGCAMIGQSMINISSGARHRISGIIAALFLLLFIVVASSFIEMIPIAALVGVMFMVVIATFAWSSLRLINKIPKSDVLVIFLVSAVTVFFDLAIAVLAGVVVSALVYSWKSSKHITAIIEYDKAKDQKTYKLFGPIFFGSIDSFNALFNYKTDPNNIVIDFENSRVWDHSALEALKRLAAKYGVAGKEIKYRRLSSDCADLLEKSGCKVEKEKEKDPHYEVVVDHNHQPGSANS